MTTFHDQGYKSTGVPIVSGKSAEMFRTYAKLQDIGGTIDQPTPTLAGERGRIVNCRGYSLTWHHDEPRWCAILPPKPIFEFTLFDANPLTFIDAQGIQWRPDRHFYTDGGSIPLLCQWIMSPWSAAPAFCGIHDPICATGVFYKHDPDWPPGTWVSMAIGRAQADRMLDDALEICGVNSTRRGLVYAGVRGWALASHQWS